jgi:RHS repeat-associated protein
VAEPATKRNPSKTADREFAAPQITLPKGGGAIRGIGEKFSASAFTGTGSLSVPIPVSPSRSGFQPELSLEYDSGSGNGAFGIGWNLSLPAIARKTDKGMPRYRDLEESDVFLISDAEDLVPVLRNEHGDWAYSDAERDGYLVRFYRPRVEGLFARIERWTRSDTGETHWRSFSKDNILSFYGATADSRINDPEHPTHIFKWFLTASYDVKGNAIHYEYAHENDNGIDLTRPSERRRSRSANRYLKRIRYGNRRPLARNLEGLETADWMFEIVFDYGDEPHEELDPKAYHDTFIGVPHSSVTKIWAVRRDPFSSYRSGFEVRTYRLCRRILQLHHFPGELKTPRCLVQSTDLEYLEKPIGSLLARVTHAGYVFEGDDRYLRRHLPPLELSYTSSPLEDPRPRPFELQEADSRNLPEGIGESQYRWLDLDGEGISGVLTEQGAGWYYKHNLGRGQFGAPKLVARKPSAAGLDSGHVQLLDVAGEGALDLVELAPASGGFYRRNVTSEGRDEGWEGFRVFENFPVLDWNDPNLRFVDLTGDGVADILITEDVAIRWHPSLLNQGFGAGVRIPAPHSEESGARVVFADRSQSIYLADMSGDGLSDIVRIRNGEVCYWPNLGYGRFGPKVVMDRSPWFDEPNLFDQRRLRLADTDGSGTTDILYVADDGIRVYLNESGNGLAERRILRGIPCADPRSISVTDFLGRGTACIVLSSPLPADAQRPLRYADLMRGRKPHLLTRIANNLGAETLVEYASSTEFYLADQAAGEPWVTRLPFPVHLVTRVETFDHVSRNRFVSRTTYHHGYYDGVEREFRGFGRVEQIDSETFDTAPGEQVFPEPTNENAAWSVPPVLTRTWYHTGVFLGLGRVSRHLSQEYYREPHQTEAMQLADTILPDGVTPEEAREACRSLKGSMLREEVYALDRSEKSHTPYLVVEGNFTIRMLQPRGRNLHGVFLTHEREHLILNYERKLYDISGARRADPRVAHSVTLEADDYGNTLRSADITYGRRFPDPSELLTDSDRLRQSRILVILTEQRWTNAILDQDEYRTPAPAATRLFELLNLHPERRQFGVTNLFRFDELRRLVAEAGDGRHDLPFEDFQGFGASGAGPYRRLFHESRTVYRSDNLDRLLPVGQIEALALPGELFRLTLTASLIETVYQRVHDGRTENLLPHPRSILEQDCGYVDLDQDGRWWAPSGRVFYSPQPDDAENELAFAKRHFFLARRYVDPFGNPTTVSYDAHELTPVETRDALGNTIHSRLDYRVLRAKQVTDANGNRAEAAFDALGMIAGTALMGKEGQELGDSLEHFRADLPESEVLEHMRHPLHDPHRILGNATTRLVYDLFAFDRTRRESQPHPAAGYLLARETHVSDLAPGQLTKIQHSFSYSDGFGRGIQSKMQAEPGRVPDHAGVVHHRWTGSGWTIFNNKGKPVREYEPFFSATHEFEFAAMTGVSPTLYYDPLDRVVATLHPEHTFEKLVIEPWRQDNWDVNDTVLENPRQDPDIGSYLRYTPEADYLPTWYEQREGGALGEAELDAARKAAQHARTPSADHADSLDRTFLSIAHNRFERSGEIVNEFYPTRADFDIQGNRRAVIDALGRAAMRYDYNFPGDQIREDSMDAGQRWTLDDVKGRSIRAFDSRHHAFRREYDALRRLTALFVRTGDGPDKLAERAEYGEGQPDPEALNLRGKLFRQFDQAGVAMNAAYDFKGNLARSSRQLSVDYRNEIDWTAPPALEQEVFHDATAYDALNRVTALTAPDGSIVRPSYNDANLVDRVEANLKGAAGFAPFVTHIDYNARGQRESIEYANGSRTTCAYDPLTFRLVHLRTGRTSDHAELQDLRYAYDPVGNVTTVHDAAQETVYFRNQVVPASGGFVYDAVNRLVEANGREHAGDAQRPETSYDDIPRVHLPLPGDGHAMRRYRERYRYDAAGNILELRHAADGNGSWNRRYHYDDIQSNNRLSKTAVAQSEDRYAYDPHGNMTRMQHLPSMRWDFRDQLISSQTQVVHESSPEVTYYVYSAGGARIRQIRDSAMQKRRSERTYLGIFEIHRESGGDSASSEVTTLHIMGDQRRVALVEMHGEETAVRYQLDNHLGSACVETDSEAAVITYEEYYPFGSTSYQAGRSLVEVSRKRYRFCAKERDASTGFYYYGARYYMPWLARWSSCDPAGIEDDINLYVFVRCNPIARIDPDGEFSKATYDNFLNKEIQKETKNKTAHEGKLSALQTKLSSQKADLTTQQANQVTLTTNHANVIADRQKLENDKTLTKAEKAKRLSKVKAENTRLVGELNKTANKITKLQSAIAKTEASIQREQRAINTAANELKDLNQLKTDFNAAYASATGAHAVADVELLTDVVMNEARDTNKASKSAIAYAYVNLHGGTVEKPKNKSEISNFRSGVTETRFATVPLKKGSRARTPAEKRDYIRNITDSIQAVHGRLNDMANAHDPVQGAQHWYSPKQVAMPSAFRGKTPITASGVPARDFTFFNCGGYICH